MLKDRLPLFCSSIRNTIARLNLGDEKAGSLEYD